ncbi:MAG TPA: SusC/RagA family TonB-linked outer membrane protein [Cyclobacteriaceae bacterium]|nr:SusC/RagA family TonB-linked outer membrane protein [Cyclobacteriaceae bacterium]
MKKFLLLCFSFVFAFTVWAQERVVTGKVSSSEDGTALPGVNVVLKGTTNGTVTDSDGNFRLTIPSGAGSLVFSFIGLQTQEVAVGDRTVVDVTLALDVTQLSEVVVTGSGVATDKKKLGIAVEAIAADKLPATPSASIDQALIGKIAGAQISSISGNPGDPVNILLRGINTVQGGTKPLIMVDGVQMAATDINSLDLSNIDRIEVVQGAASASIYGAQGANGVIQVFTKKGQKGKVQINFSTSYAENQFLNTGDVHKARKHGYITDSQGNLTDRDGNVLTYEDDGSVQGISYVYGPAFQAGSPNAIKYPNGNGATRYAIQDIRNDFNKEYGGPTGLKSYDHFDQVFKKGYTTNNTLSLSGASDKSDFSIALANNHTLSPVMQNGAVDRSNISVNVGTELFRGFKVRSTTQLVYTKNDLVPGLGAAGYYNYGKGNSLGDVGGVYSFLNTSPFFDLTHKTPDGNYPGYVEAGGFLSVNAQNPYYRQQYASQMDNKIDVVQSFDANYKVNKYLELDAKYGLNYRTESSRWTYLKQTENNNSIAYENWVGLFAPTIEESGEISNWQYSNTFQNFLANAYFRTDFQDDFGLSLPIQTSTQVGFDYRKRKYTEYDTYGYDLPLSPPFNMNALSGIVVAPGLTSNQPGDYVETFVTYGYLVNQKVDFGDYGGITAGFRSDWSSAFGGGSKPFTFPHYDGHINFGTFWKDGALASTLPYLKLRAAYGAAGIQPGAFDRYPILSARPTGQSPSYSIPITSNNPNLNVEVSKETEVGTDLTFNALKNSNWLSSINVSFTYWSRKSENVIYRVSQAPSTGVVELLDNAIDMSSKGWQLSLNMPLYNSAVWKWDLTTNWGHQLSQIDAIAGGNDIILNSGAGDASLVLTPGQIIGQIYGYKAITSADEVRSDGTPYITNNAEKANFEIVDGRLVDKRTYQIQFADEKTPLGNPNPKFNSSFINSISFKDFAVLSFQVDWVQGSHLYNQTKEWMYRDGIHGDYDGVVTIDGKTGAFPAYWSSTYYNLFGSLSGAGNNATKDFFWEDSSFARLRNVSLSFDFARIMNVPALRKLQLVLTGRNLATLTKYTGMDPEISSGGVNSAFDRGVDHNTLPNIKSYQVGLNVGF